MFSFISLICKLFLHSDNNDPSCDNNDHAQTFSFLLLCFYIRDWHSMGTWKFSVTSRGTMDWSLPKDGHISYSYHLLLTLFIICLLSVSSEGWVTLVTPNLHIYIDCCLYHIQYHQTASDIEGSYKRTQWYAGLNVAKDCSFISLLFSPE